MTYGSLAADQISTSVTGVSLGPGNATNFKNRIINGGMVIDQRNAGASVTQSTTGTYTLDRFSIYGSVTSKFTVQQNAGSVTPPAGFINYLGVTSSSAYTVSSTDEFDLIQNIEGLNVADLGWGTANAKTVTLSAWVRSSLTGTFGGSLRNSAADRSYPFSYTISSANTWTQISVTIAGDTTGTWLTTNGTGISLTFGMGQGSSKSNTAGAWVAGNYTNATGATSVVGTSGATFYITGVQLEVGSIATGFEYRDYGRELYLCQRYYEQTAALNAISTVRTIIAFSTQFCQGFSFIVQKRANPNVVFYTRNGTANKLSSAATGADTGTSVIANNISVNSFQTAYDSTGPFTAGIAYEANYTASAEL